MWKRSLTLALKSRVDITRSCDILQVLFELPFVFQYNRAIGSFTVYNFL